MDKLLDLLPLKDGNTNSEAELKKQDTGPSSNGKKNKYFTNILEIS